MPQVQRIVRTTVVQNGVPVTVTEIASGRQMSANPFLSPLSFFGRNLAAREESQLERVLQMSASEDSN